MHRIVIDGKRRDPGLGNYLEISLPAARANSAKKRSKVEDDINPAEEMNRAGFAGG
jgi:hypothetical protein